jgi:hypothetical protein
MTRWLDRPRRARFLAWCLVELRTKEHTMTDVYRITDAPDSPPPTTARKGVLRPLLWLLLVVSAAGNALTSTAGLSLFVSVAFGLATLGLGAALAVHHYRGRRR